VGATALVIGESYRSCTVPFQRVLPVTVTFLAAFSFLEGPVALPAVLSFRSGQEFFLGSCDSVISGDGNGIRLP